MSYEVVIGLVVAAVGVLGGLAAIAGWRSGGTKMPVPPPNVVHARTADAEREEGQVATARRQNQERAQELRNARNTPDRDARSDDLATIGNRRAGR